MSIEIKSNEKAFIEALKQKADEVPDRLHELVNEIGFIYQNAVMDAAPHKTYNLRASHRLENLDETTVRVYPDEGVAPYALQVILGTSPHEIKASSAQALYWPGAEHPVKSVFHPGTDPNPYWDEGKQEGENKSKTEIENFTRWLIE